VYRPGLAIVRRSPTRNGGSAHAANRAGRWRRRLDNDRPWDDDLHSSSASTLDAGCGYSFRALRDRSGRPARPRPSMLLDGRAREEPDHAQVSRPCCGGRSPCPSGRTSMSPFLTVLCALVQPEITAPPIRPVSSSRGPCASRAACPRIASDSTSPWRRCRRRAVPAHPFGIAELGDLMCVAVSRLQRLGRIQVSALRWVVLPAASAGRARSADPPRTTAHPAQAKYF